MSDRNTENAPADGGLEGIRRAKLQRIRELGFDPWGQRFDDRLWIRDIRAQAGQIQLKTATGETVAMPELEKVEGEDPKTGRATSTWMVNSADGQVAFRQWASDHGVTDFSGPTVRAAGRVVLHRTKGKLQFADIRDWTGDIQLFIGRQQIGEENWELLNQVDLGDIIGVDGELRLTKVGELSIFATKIHFLTKSIEQPPEKFHGLNDPELRQRMRYLDLTYGDGVLPRFLNSTKIEHSILSKIVAKGFV